MEPIDERRVREIITQEFNERVLAVVREAVKEAAPEAVRQTFVLFGIDPEQPTESQKDFAYLRDFRTGAHQVKIKGFIACAGAFMAGVVFLITTGIKAYFHQNP